MGEAAFCTFFDGAEGLPSHTDGERGGSVAERKEPTVRHGGVSAGGTEATDDCGVQASRCGNHSTGVRPNLPLQHGAGGGVAGGEQRTPTLLLQGGPRQR